MTSLLPKSASSTLMIGPFVDATDGFTAETALTINQADVRLSKNGATFAQKNHTAAASHNENGYYTVNINSTDTDTSGILTVAVSVSGARPVRHEYLVVPPNYYNAIVNGTTTT